jgi:hypothetical protein
MANFRGQILMKKESNNITPRCPVSGQHERAGRSIECAGCSIRQETIEFLRDQLRVAQGHNDQLQNKLLALTGDAADRYQKLRVMELAQSNSPNFSGVLPPQVVENELDEFDDFANALHDGLTKTGGRQ